MQKTSQNRTSFRREVFQIAIPVALQSMLQSSFSMIDQIMLGQLGEAEIAAVEIAGKPSFIYTFVLGAVAGVAGIMISQYLGKEDEKAVSRSLSVNLLVAVLLGVLFTALSLIFTTPFINLFTSDAAVLSDAVSYLRIVSLSFVFMGVSQIFAVPLRCLGKASWTLYVGLLSAVLNTLLNFVLIFGKFGFPMLGIRGAAFASVVSQLVSAVLMVVLYLRLCGRMRFSLRLGKDGYRQYLFMLLPVVLNEFFWTIGQSVNTFVYGNMGTDELAGMSMTSPVQGLLIGAMSGLSQAAGILIGKALGKRDYDAAYEQSKRLCFYGVIGSAVLAVLLILLRMPYTTLYRVSDDVRIIGAELLLAFAVLLPVKVSNMILGGGIIRSGGRTKYIMMIDMLGTWAVGVPLALFTGLYLRLPIVWVYFIMSQEETVRLLISVWMFRGRKWMNTLE